MDRRQRNDANTVEESSHRRHRSPELRLFESSDLPLQNGDFALLRSTMVRSRQFAEHMNTPVRMICDVVL
uniref:Carboxyvinyl-carboxyphosphonate phosphorylmutase n=1 Tax=Syphacia muris TaxID=451379 RepID=A0A0N5B140_9BILA